MVRLATEDDLERVNELRKQVNDIHVKGRQGIGRELFAFIQEDAKARGFERIELNMWEFNEGALAFNEAIGFRTYRRDMELDL